jgi:hypothetical protein
MSENPTTPPNAQNNNQSPAPYVDEREQWRQQRREWREERRASRHNSMPWLGGAILIGIGVILLLQNTGLMILNNWWALFIMIPAVGSFGTAYGLYRNAGNRLTYAARGSLIGGMVLTLITCFFLFDLSSGLFWPILLIVAGAGLLLNFVLPS